LLDALTAGAESVVAFVGAGDIERDAEAYAKVLRRAGVVQPADAAAELVLAAHHGERAIMRQCACRCKRLTRR
jgi:hypothetical protein